MGRAHQSYGRVLREPRQIRSLPQLNYISGADLSNLESEDEEGDAPAGPLACIVELKVKLVGAAGDGNGFSGGVLSDTDIPTFSGHKLSMPKYLSSESLHCSPPSSEQADVTPTEGLAYSVT